MTEEFVFFFRKENPFSQWYIRDFRVNDLIFNCCEKWMMYQKAILFGDTAIAKLILNSHDPHNIKKLGRMVSNFSENIWNENSKNIVYQGNYHKFTQNSDLLEILKNTRGKTLVETSPYDIIWGIGLSSDDPRAKDRKLWRGTNYLGEILTKLRKDILCE